MQSDILLAAVQKRASDLGINPLLLLSGIEGIYTFKDVPLNQINFTLLDNLILTIFALRVGDEFHALAEQGLVHENETIRSKAVREMKELNATEITTSGNEYLRSFANLLGGKTPVRRYHEKALEVAAVEISQMQVHYQNNSIGNIMLSLCNREFFATVV
jgi:hypothetical protein